MSRTALYIRSSKDRADASIDAQRRELMKLAKTQGLEIITEYVDAVESAKSEHRPAFQRLLVDMKNAKRGWDHLLLLDTSRLSRRRYVAQVFKHEARKRGVTIQYARLPQTDPITGIVLEAVFEAFDEVHSLMSKEKGLAGMRENVLQGYRAGGRAPRGYQLVRTETGAIREGEPVRKSTLEPNEDATKVTAYLKRRAAGVPRATVMRDLGIKWSPSTMIGMEWNAQTYAGHTVWNRRNESEPGGGYAGGTKYRPREEWVTQRDTHKALITDGEADRIIENLENSVIGKAVSDARRGVSPHLLSGVLVTPTGQKWDADRGNYRLRPGGKYIAKSIIETAVVRQVIADMKSDEFIDAMVKAAKTVPADMPGAEQRKQLDQILKKIDKAAGLALQLADPQPILDQITKLQVQRDALQRELRDIDRDFEIQKTLQSVTRSQIKMLVNGLVTELQEIERPRLRGIMDAIVERITLNPETRECMIHYRLSVASPRVGDSSPVIRVCREVGLAA